MYIKKQPTTHILLSLLFLALLSFFATTLSAAKSPPRRHHRQSIFGAKTDDAVNLDMIITKRSSPNIQYSFTLNVYFANDDNSNNKKGRDQKDEDPTLQKMTRIHAIAEDYSNHHFLEYKSDFDQMLNELTTFEQLNNETKCYSLTHSNSNKSSPWISHDDSDDDAFGSMITISQWNQLVNSLQAYTPSQPLSSIVFYDQGVDELMRNNDLSPLVGQLQSNDENDETALVFVDNQSGLMVHVITERVHVQIMQISTGETQKVKDSVDRLNRQCTNLNDEIAALLQMNKKSNQQHRVNTMRRPTMKKAPPSPMDMWFLDNDRSCRLPFVRHDKNCATNQMKAAPVKQKVCVFLHGSGETAILPPSNIKERYWGNVHEFTPQCSERWFISMDTKNYGWDNYDLQKGYCQLAAFHNKTVPEGTPAIIKDTIVFSHSMGNLILAAGLKNGFCSMANSSSWYSVSSPYGGSVASPMLKELCYNYYYGKSPNLFRKLAGYIAQGGYCLVNTPNAYPSYLSLDPDYCSTQEPKQCIKDLEPVTQAYVTGASCGLSPYGLASRYSILLGALSTIVGYGQKNDGMVGKSSCEIYHANSFTNNVRNVFYSTGCNHADATCRNGNGWWGASRQPCSYYTDKV